MASKLWPTRPSGQKHWGRSLPRPIRPSNGPSGRGAVAAYREAHGYQSIHDPIGPAPLASAVEARAAWQRAYNALGRPEAERAVAGATDAELRSRRGLQAGRVWAPPHVDAELREKSLSLEDWRTALEIEQAELAIRSADEDQGRDTDAAERLHNQRAAMYELEADVAALEEISEARAAWYEETRQARDRAHDATRELQIRGKTIETGDEAPERQGPDHEHDMVDVDQRRQQVELDKPRREVVQNDEPEPDRAKTTPEAEREETVKAESA